MKLVEFLEQTGFRPKKIKEYEYGKGWIEKENTNIVIRSNLQRDRSLVYNNIDQDLIFGRVHGTQILFAIKIRGGFAFFLSNRNTMDAWLERISISKFNKLNKKFDMLSEMITYNFDNEKLNTFLFATELAE